MKPLDYDSAIELLYSSLPVFHSQGPGAYKPGLDTSRQLSRLFGDPHRAYACIHIAGTNGKGSTAHTLAAILQSAGYRTGLYTSPHIFDFRERVRIDGVKIERGAVARFVDEWLCIQQRRPGLKPSFFELTSTMAMRCFADSRVDVAVIETGLGGRLDSTNIITPVLSVITNISPDHTALLGDTRAAIAAEKAGIIKPGVPAVVGEDDPETRPVFEAAAAAAGAPLHFASPLECIVEPGGNYYPHTPCGPLRGQLRGECQGRNAATVLEAVGLLRKSMDIPDSAVARGLEHVADMTGLFGRWTPIGRSPLTVADTGHNVGGWEYIARELASRPETGGLQLVMGFVADKDLTHIMELLAPLRGRVGLWYSAPTSPRGLTAQALAAKAAQHGLEGTVEPDVNKALAMARRAAGPDGFVLIAGSNFLLADLDPRAIST